MANNHRLAAAAHYVIARIPTHRLGAVRLNKILWFADCTYFARHGRSLTGEESYIRKPLGPCSAHLENTLEQLRREGFIAEAQGQTVLNQPIREFTSLIEPDLCDFTGEEVDLLMAIARAVSKMTAKEASDISHDALWDETPPYAQMSVAAGAAAPEEITDADLEWGRTVFA